MTLLSKLECSRTRISKERDTTFVDTTLNVKRDYKFNYLRKDNFNLMPFSNVGQSYNTLIYSFNDLGLMPSFGAVGH